MNAALDVVLTKQLNAGKLFVGQKLRVSYIHARYTLFCNTDFGQITDLQHAYVLISYLKILGAGLSGWATPTSPLEVSQTLHFIRFSDIFSGWFVHKSFIQPNFQAVISSTICLLLNINGTYRAHWADRLGFCKQLYAVGLTTSSEFLLLSYCYLSIDRL